MEVRSLSSSIEGRSLKHGWWGRNDVTLFHSKKKAKKRKLKVEDVDPMRGKLGQRQGHPGLG